ncbi:MAG TPA: hypothetical protein VL688_02920 [Verrucomicrobiae bacterium]|jgi:hypothetical protein|nr:hypothetical protein [Verrucomicrobiae bacterium]
MNRRFSGFALAVVVFTLILPAAYAGESPYQAAPEAPSYFFCTANQSQREMPDESISPAKAFYSGAFTAQPEKMQPVMSAFGDLLKEKYGFTPDAGQVQPVACTGVKSMEQAQATEKLRVESSRRNKAEVIETGWIPAA